MSDTLLVLSGIGIPEFSARGLTQALTPIEGAKKFRRTTNGVLIDISPPSFLKYRSEITCTDQRPPAIDGKWPGQLVTVSCACLLSYPSGGSPARTVVIGSSFTENGFTFYRPQLDMMVTDFQEQFAEWHADYQWKITLEEV